MRNYHKDGTQALGHEIFVFGSNESGWHGAGAAKAALDHYDAVLGVGYGIQGQSFAIPTKDWVVNSLTLYHIEFYVNRFIAFANNSHDRFFITRIGCGLAGNKDADIAPLFRDAQQNCNFPEEWKEWLE